MARYYFDNFQLLEEEKQLFDGEKQIPLTNRRFAILLILLQHAGEIVTKEELIAKVWEGMIVEESNISQQIYQLRLLLGDNARHQNFIETLPSIGYRFKVNVQREETVVAEEAGEAMTTVDLPGSPVVVASAEDSEGSRRRRYFSLAGAMMVGVLVWIGAIVAREDGLIGNDRSQPRDPTIRLMVSLPGVKTHPAFSRDGRWISFSLRDSETNNFDLYLIEAEQPWTLVPRRLTSHPLGELHSTWSPDSRKIAFLRLPEIPEERFRLMVLDLESKHEREVGRVWGGLDWSPDGQFFAVSDNLTEGTSSGIFLLSTDGRERRPVSTPPPAESIYDFNPRFSTDGTQLIFIRGYTNTLQEIFLIDLRSGALRQLTYDQKTILGAAVWAPGGKDLLFISNRSGNFRLWRMPAAGGEPRIVESVQTGQVTGLGAPNSLAISPANQQMIIGSESQDSHILVRGLPGGAREQEQPCWIQSSESEHTPYFSPSGKGLLFGSNRSGRDELWTVNDDCTEPSPLTRLEEIGVRSGTWSPDGNWIIFERQVDFQPEIFRLNLWDRSFHRLTNHPNSDVAPSPSRDGRWIYFSSNRSGKHQIWRIPAAGGDPVELTREGGIMCRESYDGRTLFYNRNEYLRRLDLRTGEDREVAELKGINVGYTWDVGKEYLYFLPQKTPGSPIVNRYHLKTSKVERLFTVDGFTSPDAQGLSVNAAEDRIAITTVKQHSGSLKIIERWE